MKYDHTGMEAKWQKQWEEKGVFHASNDSDKPKYYTLIEFPYPSGQGLHVGHPRSYTALDIVARKRRLMGYNVLYPIGWDAFGLPTENFAIKNHVHPEVVTKKNIARFKQQLQSLGISFDWSREINTTDPSYYKWTQWIFLQLFKHGLAYKKEAGRELVHLLQVRAGQRRSGQRRVRALRQRGDPQEPEPMDAEDHRLCPAAGG
ncbi:MAG: class I tRNA ligase family protein [[Clostridium] leptum]